MCVLHWLSKFLCQFGLNTQQQMNRTRMHGCTYPLPISHGVVNQIEFLIRWSHKYVNTSHDDIPYSLKTSDIFAFLNYNETGINEESFGFYSFLVVIPVNDINIKHLHITVIIFEWRNELLNYFWGILLLRNANRCRNIQGFVSEQVEICKLCILFKQAASSEIYMKSPSE